MAIEMFFGGRGKYAHSIDRGGRDNSATDDSDDNWCEGMIVQRKSLSVYRN